MRQPVKPPQSRQFTDYDRLGLIAEYTKNMVIAADERGCIEWVNDSFEQHTGYSLAEVRGKNPTDLLGGPDTNPKTLARINAAIREGTGFDEDILYYTKTGKPYWVRTSCIAVGEAEGVRPGFLAIQNNISDHKSNERSLRIAASLFDRSHEAVLITDNDNRILDVNDAFSRITGYPRDEVLGLSPGMLGSGRHSSEYYQSMWRDLEETGYWHGEIWNRRKNGEEYVELLSISRVNLDELGKHHYVATFSDITALKNHARELDRATKYDLLTGLPNRHGLEDRLRQAQLHADRLGRSMSVCYLDLDGLLRSISAWVSRQGILP